MWPDICYFFDVSYVDGAPVLVLELLTDGTLGQYIGLVQNSTPTIPSDPTGDRKNEEVTCPGAETSPPGQPPTEAAGRWREIASPELFQLAKVRFDEVR